jgi:hypothetical protein
MKRWEVLWLAFEKFAIFFSFAVTFTLVMVLLVAAFVLWQHLPTLQAVKDGLVCDTITGLNIMLDDFESATITRTIPISETIPVVFDLPLNQVTNARLANDVPLNRGASFTLPAGGGRINGTVYLELPRGQNLPVHLNMSVPVSETVPVEMQVNVAIPLRETELGIVIEELRRLLAPLQLSDLERVLGCKRP